MSQSNLLQEIEADLQRQKFEALWKRYGLWVIGLALAIVLGTAAVTSWRNHVISQHQQATNSLIRITNSKETDGAKRITAYNAFAAAYPEVSQATLARFQAAAIELTNNKTAEAVAYYDAIAADKTAEPVFRQLADLLAVEAQMDSGEPAALQTRLQPLMTDSAWRSSAKEFSAHLALRAGDKAKARQLFTELSQTDTATPATVTQRAKYMATWLNEGS